MGRTIVRAFLWILGGVAGAVLLLVAAAYIPAVQRWVKDRAVQAISRATGMRLDIGRFRVRFPLVASFDDAFLITPAGDTLITVRQFGVGVPLRPLLRRRVEIARLDLTEATVHWVDTLGGIALRARLDRLALRSGSMGLGTNTVDVSSLTLAGATVDLLIGENRKPPTADTLVPWTIRLDRLDLDSVDFRMRTTPRHSELTAALPHGRVRAVDLDLGGQRVAVRSIALDAGRYAYLTGPSDDPAPKSAPAPDSLSRPWTITLESLDLSNNALAYGLPTGAPKPGFDPNHLRVDSINLNAGAIRSRGAELSAELRRLTARERSGLEITEGSGRLAMDADRMTLGGLTLRTAGSSLQADASVGTGMFALAPEAPVAARLSAAIDPAEFACFYAPDPALRRALGSRPLRVEGRLAGTLAGLDVAELRAVLPGRVDLSAGGTVADVLHPGAMSANIHLNGTFTRLDTFSPLLPDSLRGRIGFPARMTLGGTVAVAAGACSADLRVGADSGLLTLRGRLDPRRQAYRIDAAARAFPIGTFWPGDSLGRATLTLAATGVRFDPRDEGAAADLELQVDRFESGRHAFHDVRLTATLAGHLLHGTIASDNEEARARLDLAGELSAEKYAARIRGAIDTLDLHALGVTADPFVLGIYLDGRATLRLDTLIRGEAYVAIDTLRVEHAGHTDRIYRTALEAEAGSGQVTASARNGDLKLDFETPVPLDSLGRDLARAGRLLAERLDSALFTPTAIERVLPPLRLRATAGRDNFVHPLLAGAGFDFLAIDLTAANPGGGRPMQAFATIDGLQTGRLTLDTLSVGVYREYERLNYFARLAGRPGNIEQLALLGVSGSIDGNRLTADVVQHNRADSVGFAFGLEARLLDSAIRVQVTPLDPVLGYIPWTASADNYLVYHFDRSLEADLRLEGPEGKHLYLLSAALPPSLPAGAVRVDSKNLDIGHLLALLPVAPPADGSLSTLLTVGFDRGQLVARGTLGVDSLSWQGTHVGDVGLDLDLRSDSPGSYALDASAAVAGRQALKVDGTYLASDGSLDLRASLTALPLEAVGAFLPEGTVAPGGNLSGTVAATGRVAAPVVDGQLTFENGTLAVPMIGTSFKLSDGPIRVEKNRVDFGRFSLLSPDGRQLVIDGTVDVGDRSHPTADVTLSAGNFDLINTPRGAASPVTGKALLDLDATARGGLDALVVRGQIDLLSGTDVVYTPPQGPDKVESRQQHFVRFVDFSDPATLTPDTVAPRARLFGVDMLVNIDIDDRVRATVNVSPDGSNRGEVTGGGELAFTMNPQGDSRFTGRYTLTGGTVVYHPPVIAAKNFTIDPESYVEWTGAMLDPVFNIKADETVRTSVQADGSDGARAVDFTISILVRNSLKNVDLSFDLSAPGDPDIGYQLASLAPEQRSQQAMALLVYNTYTGPGTTARVDATNPLNTFIARELNQWARDNLRGVDVSLGVGSGQDAAGGTHTDYSYRVSKRFMDDRISVAIGGSVGAGGEQRLQNNFVDDISVEYRLTDRDNLFLRAFRHNARVSMLEGEVVETGGGFLLRKKMNRMSELFKLAPKAERRLRREMRRQLRARDQAPAP